MLILLVLIKNKSLTTVLGERKNKPFINQNGRVWHPCEPVPIHQTLRYTLTK